MFNIHKEKSISNKLNNDLILCDTAFYYVMIHKYILHT